MSNRLSEVKTNYLGVRDIIAIVFKYEHKKALSGRPFIF